MITYKNIFFVLFLISFLSAQGQTYLTEGFETGAKPDGWTEETAIGDEPWRFRNGGHSPNDNNWMVPADQEDITRNPPSAYEGTYNAIFFKQSDNNERTKLITPEMDLLGGANVQLSFYLCQIPWNWEGSTSWDILRIYYKTSEEGPWNLLKEYLDPIYDWTLQTLLLPNPNETYYLAFEGQTRWGYGTCIDDIMIEEIGAQEMYINEVVFSQPFPKYVPSGTKDVPLMRMDMKVVGNTGSVQLDEVTFTSLNTDDNDITASSLKLYATATQEFSKAQQVGTATGFSGGQATFTGINHTLPRGLSYVWLAGDIEPGADHNHILDLEIRANDLSGGGNTFPESDESPLGNRTIWETVFSENFDQAHSWAVEPEFEVTSPAGEGAQPGNANPTEAFSPPNVLGTDLTGLGDHPYKYEPGLDENTAYKATSPAISIPYYKSLNIFYRRFLNIEVWDNASIEVSDDNGVNWHTVWQNDAYLTDFQWVQEQISIPDAYSRTSDFKMRFVLGPTDGAENYSGWSIDNIFLTGEFISKDVGVVDWISPVSGSGHSDADSITIRVANFGGAPVTATIPVAFSLDGGDNWTVNQMTRDLDVGDTVEFTFASTADFSEPGLYPDIRAKTFLPGDQYRTNDEISTEVYVIPTYTAPYSSDFETTDGFWITSGIDLWEYGTPSGLTINTAASGSKAWMTGLNNTYGYLLSRTAEYIFTDDFESDMGWTFEGEFERANPNTIYTPYFAYSGYYCIGTDLTGRGDSLYQYENNIGTGNAFTATTPAMDVSNYSNIQVTFARWYEIMQGDSAKLEVSPDNGNTWQVLWRNNEGAISDQSFIYESFEIPDALSYATQLKIRLSLFHTSTSGDVAPGIFVDDFSVSGDYVELVPGILTSPVFDLTGLDNPVLQARIWIDTEPDTDGVMLYSSADNGLTWQPVENTTSYDTYWNWYTGEYTDALEHDGWNGHSGGWIGIKHLLPESIKGESEVKFQFRFRADKLNNEFDGLAFDDIRITEAPNDVSLDEILAPGTACELGENEHFTLRFSNQGIRTILPGDSITVNYYIDMDGFIQTAEETMILTDSYTTGTSFDLAMDSEFDMSMAGSYIATINVIEEDPFYYRQFSNDTVMAIIEVSKPYVDLGPDISTTRPDTVVLDAGPGEPGYAYTWQDNSNGRYFNVSTEGTYHVEVDNGSGCYARDTVQVLQLVLDAGISSFTGPASACELGSSLPVTVQVQNFGTDIIEPGDTIFVFADIDGSTVFADTLTFLTSFYPGETVEHTFTGTYDFSETGDHPVDAYTVLKDDQVAGNDTLHHIVQAYGYPDAYLGADTIVFAGEYILSPEPGFSDYLWQDGSTDEQYLINTPGSGVYYVRISDTHGCVSYDTVNVTLNTDDLSLYEILSPANDCELSQNINVSAKVRNLGNQVISSGTEVILGYQVNGGVEKEESFVLGADLPTGGTVDLTFSTAESLSTGQWYDFTIYVDLASDTKRTNDTIEKTIGVFETPVVDLGDEYQVITATEHTLDAGEGFVSYLWQDGSTAQTYTITQPGIGHYEVTVVDVNGCEVTQAVDILLAVPDVGILDVLSPSSACALGTEEQLTVVIKNFGNYAIEPGADLKVVYSLNGGEEVTETVPLSESFDGGAELEYTFGKVEDMSAPGSYEFVIYTEYAGDQVPTNDILFRNVDVFGSPVIDINDGEDTIFTSVPVTLTVEEGYASYLWQDGSTGTQYDISDPGVGMYTVDVDADNGCITSDSVFVVFDIPDLALLGINSPVSACADGTTQNVSVEVRNNGFYRLSSTDSVTLSYSVNSQSSVFEKFAPATELQPGASMVMTFTQGFNFPSPGNYELAVSLIYLEDTDFSNNLLNSTVTIWNGPEVTLAGGADTIETDLPYTLDAGAGFSSYLWRDNSTNSTMEVSTYGTQWVIVTDNNGCTGSDTVYMKDPTSVETAMLEKSISIYPNPADDALNIILDMNGKSVVRIELFSIDHKLLYQDEIEHLDYSELKIDPEQYEPGTYILRITAGDVPLVKRIVFKE